LAVEARKKLMDQQVKARVVSMPSWELFEVQPRETRDAVLPPSVKKRLAIEAGITQGWHRYAGDEGDVMGIDHFGASAPGEVVMREFGFTVENVCQKALALLRRA
jgi:transketolase